MVGSCDCFFRVHGQSSLIDRFSAALEEKGSAEGAAEVREFMKENRAEVAKVLSLFGTDGRRLNGQPFTASCYNDFYKWTMLPVVLAVERACEGVRCTFSVNIRDADYRQRLLESATGKGSPELFDEVVASLRTLTQRPFDRGVFEKCAEEYKLPHWDGDTLDAVCGPADQPRMLVQEFKADAKCSAPAAPEAPGAVMVQVFVARDEKLKQERVYIEATGPWARVTWLETTMMQAVYDALFRDRMRSRHGVVKTPEGFWDDGLWYPHWLADAMCRCARSVKAGMDSGMKGALFTGRRTGGLALMVLQGMYVQKTFRSAEGASLHLGSSSVTSRYLCLAAGVDPELVPRCAGTHAHELSMTIGAVIGDVDDKCGVPLSQAVGHLLYFYRSLPQGDVQEGARRALFPMLPDTLGSRAFMRTVAPLKVPFGAHKGEPVLSIIGAARQDSGTLKAFKELMGEFEYKGGLMASEIETAADLTEAHRQGFGLFGAGGFMGDSEKAWDSTKGNISMAVKVLRVHVGGVQSAFPPVKTGETGASGQIKEGKFEADGTLSPDKVTQVRQRAQLLSEANAVVGEAELQRLLEEHLRRFLPDEFLS